MNKILFFTISILGILIVLIGFFIFFSSSNNSSMQTEYEKAIEYLERGNQWVITNNYNEHCRSNYRYYDRGCYYNTEAKNRPDKSIIDYKGLGSFDLDSSQKLEICKGLAHKGEAAYCLNYYNYTDECLDFAENVSGEYCAEYDSKNITPSPACLVFGKNSEYLKRICSLKQGEVIYSIAFASQEECGQNGCFPFMSYSTFI